MRSSNTSRKRLAAWLLAGAMAQSVWAIDPNRAMSQYIRDRWGPEQGFPRGPVYAITQTADGYLWIGTDEGLVRFDGWNFRLVADSTGSLNIRGVLGLTPDSSGNLWVRLRDLTILRYRDGKFENPKTTLQPFSNISVMSHTNQGELLVSKMEDGAFAFRNGQFEKIAAATDLPRSPVMALTQTPDGSVWMGTRDAGLFRLGAGRTTSVTQGLPDSKINCLLPAGATDLWVCTDNGVVRWDGSRLTTVGLPAALGQFQALAMERDRDNNVWVGTDSRGLLRLNARGVSSLDARSAPYNEAITAIFEDREGNIWVGSAGAIERLRDSVFVTYSVAEGFPAAGGGPVYVDAEGRAWFAPVDGGLYRMSGQRAERVTAGGLGQDVVYSIAGSGSDVWIGRQHGGLTHLNTATGSTQTYTESGGLAQNSVYAVHRGRDRTVWAGTVSGGVSRLHDGAFRTFTMADGLASNTVSSILEGADGTMWFATPAGLSSLASDKWRTLTMADGLPSDNVHCLLEDSGGVLWIGTAAGLASFRGGQVKAFTDAPPALREQILGLAEDSTGALWIATSGRVARVHREKLQSGALAAEDLREYGIADGLRSTEGVKRHRSVVADSLGRIWFSLIRGLSVVDPARLKQGSAPAIAQVQTIAADTDPIDLRNEVRIPPGHRRITFGFTGLMLAVPDRALFRYKLEGYDRDWSEPTATREANYTNLEPRSYRFRVMASNAEGLWNGKDAEIGVVIEPEYWQTWWFRLGLVFTLLLAVLAAYRYRVVQMASHLNVRFEERLAERTRIAQELHDTLLQGFLSASMQLHVAAERVPAESPAKPQLNRVLQLMGQVIEEGRNAVRGLRSSTANSSDLEQALSRIPEEMSARADVGFRVIVDGHPRPLHPVLRDEVYRIGREALVNAYRHSQAKGIEVELEYASRFFRLLVRDNGCGIDANVLRSGRDGHWGLAGMRERAERIGGKLNVFSSASAGTEVVLSVPRHIAFQSSSAQSAGWFSRWTARRRMKSRELESED